MPWTAKRELDQEFIIKLSAFTLRNKLNFLELLK